MWRVVIASVVLAAGCTESIDYEVTVQMQASRGLILVDGATYQAHADLYQVSSYDELRDVGVSVTVRDGDIDSVVVLPFAASACGSSAWQHSGELVRIEVEYIVRGGGASYYAFTNTLTCTDDEGEVREVYN